LELLKSKGGKYNFIKEIRKNQKVNRLQNKKKRVEHGENKSRGK
jgi:hypothetical protein